MFNSGSLAGTWRGVLGLCVVFVGFLHRLWSMTGFWVLPRESPTMELVGYTAPPETLV